MLATTPRRQPVSSEFTVCAKVLFMGTCIDSRLPVRRDYSYPLASFRRHNAEDIVSSADRAFSCIMHIGADIHPTAKRHRMNAYGPTFWKWAWAKSLPLPHHNHFTALFPGPPGSASAEENLKPPLNCNCKPALFNAVL